MKRKGFTLVELLIIVAIIGALAAVMMVSSGSSIAKTKATAIANNLRICTTAAQLYYLESGDSDTDVDSITGKQVLSATVPNFADFSTGNVTYVSDDTAGHTAWNVTVELSGADSLDILKSLKTINGFKSIGGTKNVKYTLFTGKAADVN